jgi:hypothetical protein
MIVFPMHDKPKAQMTMTGHIGKNKAPTLHRPKSTGAGWRLVLPANAVKHKPSELSGSSGK